MEYTKDIILDIRCKKEIGITKFKSWTGNIKKGIKNNKIIVCTMSLLTILIAIDIVLVNSFLQLLTNLY